MNTQGLKIAHLVYVPFTGLGLYKGFRGQKWLRNRIQIFKQFVATSLLNQSKQDFIVWISWRPEEKDNPLVLELETYLRNKFRVIFTYHGLCFWDDKYPDDAAAQRLSFALLETLPELSDVVGDAELVYMTIQPSDDLYCYNAIEQIQDISNLSGVIGWGEGYIVDYNTRQVAEYNPTTNPPFFTIVFPQDKFFDLQKHLKHTGPYKSHEYIVNFLPYKKLLGRGFMVGTHGENISTYFHHPFAGRILEGYEKEKILSYFGIDKISVSLIKRGLRRRLFHSLPYHWQKKIRYLLGERFYARFYEFIRS